MPSIRMKPERTRKMRRLEAKLRSALDAKDFGVAKRCVARTTAILRSAGHETRSLKYKNAYFEHPVECLRLFLTGINLIGKYLVKEIDLSFVIRKNLLLANAIIFPDRFIAKGTSNNEI